MTRTLTLWCVVAGIAISVLSAGCSDDDYVQGPCGEAGQRCCPDWTNTQKNVCHRPNATDPNPLVCDGSKCVPCAGEGQPCCNLGVCPGSLQCLYNNNGNRICVNCGKAGQSCCLDGMWGGATGAFCTIDGVYCTQVTGGTCGPPSTGGTTGGGTTGATTSGGTTSGGTTGGGTTGGSTGGTTGGGGTACASVCASPTSTQTFACRSFFGCALGCAKFSVPPSSSLACAACICQTMFSDPAATAVAVANAQACITYSTTGTDPSGMCHAYNNVLALNNNDAITCTRKQCGNSCTVVVGGTCP